MVVNNTWLVLGFTVTTILTSLRDTLEILPPVSMQNLSFCNIKQGYNNVDGQCALRFARERKSYATGDRF